MSLLYSVTLFLGAGLLFIAQLVFARLVLPLLGGSPAVWNTSMVFYQAVLLAGYSYAHIVSRRLRLRGQVLLQLVVLGLPFLVLPFAVPKTWTPPADANPIPWLLGILTMQAALPLFAVSTISPLLQKWFSATGHTGAADPYFLYAASNAGSVVGLLSYPFVIEPATTLWEQSRFWLMGYAVLAVLSLCCAWLARRSPSKPEAENAEPGPSWSRRFRWVACTFVASSLMLSVTAYISSDVAAVPLLWVLPLVLYLFTFILVFSRREILPRRLMKRALPIVLVPTVMALAANLTVPILLLALLHLVTFFVAATVCHGDVARDRPAVGHLTEFYLWISIGGVLGGVFNALLAPIIFRGFFEYPLMLVAVAFICVSENEEEKQTAQARKLDVLLPLALAGLTAILVYSLWFRREMPGPRVLAAVFGIPSLLCFFMSRRRLRFSLGLAAILFVGQLVPPGGGRVIYSDRSFFGLHRVTQDAGGTFHRLLHGQTVHGVQSTDPARPCDPLSYYHRTGPLGQVFEQVRRGPIAGIGMGAGAAACYGRPGEEFTFFEIDPVVKHVALDPRFFSYLRHSAADVNVVLGDGRVSLASAPDHHYQLMILDAYSSDSIPVHLLTREALNLYLRKLAPGGLLAFHISNIHMHLRPVVANLARDAGWTCLVQEESDISDKASAEGKMSSQWAVMAEKEGDLGGLSRDSRWQRDPGDPAQRVWTDDYSSVVNVLNFGLW